LDEGDTPGSTGTLAVSRSGQAALRREQWERSENEHRGMKKKPNNRKEGEMKPRRDIRMEERAVH
jgi:hypothetical protein